MRSSLILLCLTQVSIAVERIHYQTPVTDYGEEGSLAKTWLEKYGKQIDRPFSGPLAFSHLAYTRCLEDDNVDFDIAILGMPFDTGVTYRPGARFGPYAIRSGSRRQQGRIGYTMSWGNNPYEMGLKILDCGDVRIAMDCIKYDSKKCFLFPRCRLAHLTMR
jgi:Arginase/agmatinase/formimionoglutamate hydrolase, arginase family